MNHAILEDKQAGRLLSRVRDDLTGLRTDVRNLVRHTTRQTLPNGARQLARNGREHLHQGREFATSQLRRAGRGVREHPAGVSVAGAVLIGALALGVFYLLRGGYCAEIEDGGAAGETR